MATSRRRLVLTAPVGFLTVDGAGTDEDPYTTTVTVLRADGTTDRVTLDGQPNYTGSTPIALGADGTVASLPTPGPELEDDPIVTTVTVLRPDGTSDTATVDRVPVRNDHATRGRWHRRIQAIPAGQNTQEDPITTDSCRVRAYGAADTRVNLPGYAYIAAQGDDGTVLVRYYDASQTDTTMIVLRPDGSETRFTAPGHIAWITHVGADGTVAVATESEDGAVLTVVRPDGTKATAGHAAVGHTDSMLGADGTATLSTGTGTGSDTDPYKTTVTVLRPDGSTSTETIDG